MIFDEKITQEKQKKAAKNVSVARTAVLAPALAEIATATAIKSKKSAG